MPPVGWHLAVELSVCPSKNLNVGLNFCNIEDSNLIFGMHVYLIKLHILSGERSRPMSCFKFKCQNTKSREAISFKREIIF